MELSIRKTQFIIFHRTKNKTLPEYLEVEESRIQRLNAVRYLGLAFNSGLRWVDHLNILKFKILKYINTLTH